MSRPILSMNWIMDEYRQECQEEANGEVYDFTYDPYDDHYDPYGPYSADSEYIEEPFEGEGDWPHGYGDWFLEMIEAQYADDQHLSFHKTSDTGKL